MFHLLDVGFLRYQPYNDTSTSGKDKEVFLLLQELIITVEVEGISGTSFFFNFPKGQAHK